MEKSRLGEHRILTSLGAGGMGKVYLAEVAEKTQRLEVGERVAVKVIHAHLLETKGFFKRFLREAEIGRQVVHENVVRTYDCDAVLHKGTQQNFLVMEYVEGQTLRDLLTELKVVPEELCRHIARELTKALEAIHAVGVIHRDLKPENALITEDNTVKVMDLGVAHLQDELIRLSQTGTFVGSIHYAAPEQFRGRGRGLDARADLHALGGILYQLATGAHPYYDEDVRVVLSRILTEEPRRIGERNPQLSPFFEEVVGKLMAKDREDRFASATELLQVLEEEEESTWWKERARTLRIETKRPLRRMHVARDSALFGREEELTNLRGLYEQARAGRGQVLFLEGEAGIGRTRLVDEFVGKLQAEGEDLNFLFGGYPPGGAATASGAFSTAYREQFGAEGLEEALGDYLSQCPLLIPAFAALLRGEPTPKGEEPLGKGSLQTVFVRATRAPAAERPTIVLIDDLHFAPEDGRALFASLALAIRESRVLLIGTSRHGLPETWISGLDRQDHFTRLMLHRLSARDVGALILDVFRSKRLADGLGFEIVTKADGNPFFVFEIIRSLREGSQISQTGDGTWISSREIRDIQIPSSVVDMIEARIADVAEEDRDLLDLAACCGFEFDPGLVADALGMARIPALKRIGRLEKMPRIVRSEGRHFVFDHHQIQEALYEGLPEMLREEYHGKLAEILESRVGREIDPTDLPGPMAVDLCTQFCRSGRHDRGVRYMGAALDHMERGYLNNAALSLMDNALGVDGLLEDQARVDLLLRKSRLLGLLGRRADELEVLNEILPQAEALGVPLTLARAHLGMGEHLHNTSRYQEAEAALDRALEHAREAGDKLLEARAGRVAGNVCMELGQDDRARAHYERGIVLACEVGNLTEEGGSTNNLANVFNRRGEVERSRVLYEQSLVLLRQTESRQFECRVMGNLADVYRMLGLLDEARSHRENALRLAHACGDRMGEAMALAGTGSD